MLPVQAGEAGARPSTRAAFRSTSPTGRSPLSSLTASSACLLSWGRAACQLILAAYQQRGLDCPTYLLGDFAFAIWDNRQRTLFCVCDPLGIRPFYFFQSPRLFIFASDIRGVMAHAAAPSLCF